jgi:penicillin-binding protein 1B
MNFRTMKFRLPPAIRLSSGGIILAAIIAMLISAAAIFAHYYLRYARMVDETLRAGNLESSSILYASPRVIAAGAEESVDGIASYLRRCGYSESKANPAGWYSKQPDTIEIHPGSASYVQQAAAIQVQSGHVSQIVALRDRTALTQVALEPEVITNFVDQNRDKQLMVQFPEIPKVLVNAVLSAEDKRFFQHWGVDPAGILRAAWVDARQRRNSQGASTITQQLARTLWLGQERGWRRKIPETLITLHLEHTLTKQQIFEDYANSIYLGHVGSFSVRGFGMASRLYLGKDLSQLTTADAALLAGMIEAPYLRNPFRYPDRARQRRDVILKAMRANGFLEPSAYLEAAASPLKVAHEANEGNEAPYFVDLVDEKLQSDFQDRDFLNSSLRVYTTLDMDLQKTAVEAVRTGIAETDQQWRQRSKQYGTIAMPRAQTALVALDTQTGEVKALVGGRDYGVSQFNHAVARRQPGSSFKPFVYAAALSPSRNGPAFTAASTLSDEPTTFFFHGKSYDPSDSERTYAGDVTLRFALAHSLNIPAVKVAEEVGYDQVVRIARAAGLNEDIQPTPAIALGSYEVTPLEMAGAYTIFANYGARLKTSMVHSIRDQQGGSIYDWKPEKTQVIDARTAYVVESMMEEVLRSGTGAGVRSRGFYLPAAGKTGSSHDGWFAGFTSRLICVVWVGFDDNRDIKIEGARTALPIWTEFMKRAHQMPAYKNVHGFAPPSGVVSAEIDAETGELATADCPHVRNEVFIAGSEPEQYCRVHGRGKGGPVALEGR